ncbi:AaceriAGR067Wp [[Ashbya] aceris (nom. inval.)]|nr:AaceriAGR067Wp [[Ashbya] aceris (nom. inval.)]
MGGYVGNDPYQSPTFGQSLSLRVDGGFNAVSINPSGRDVVLASRTGLYIVDIDDPFSPPRWLQHITSWQVADVQWSPHAAKPYWVVSTSNQKAIVWNLARSSSNAVEHELHGHTRAITDINFHPIHPELLATCSIDTYVHAWDMRCSQRPFYGTSDWSSGASQVKWNFKDANTIASSHASTVFIWDIRKGSAPLYRLNGSGSSVNNIDFNRNNECEIMSSYNDGTIRFWDYGQNSESAQFTINADFPVWRGRYLPFGEGCCVMPLYGGNNSVYLVNNNWKHEDNDEKETKLQPIYVFKGHTDIVKDFLWRSRHTNDSAIDDREFQLVTWSKDCDLRLWPVTQSTYDKVNFERNKQLQEKLPNYEYVTYRKEPEKVKAVNHQYKVLRETFVTNSGLQHSQNSFNHLDWVSGVKMNQSNSPHDFFSERTLQNLGEEVSQVGHKFKRIIFERISVSTGELVVTLNGPWVDNNPEEYVFLRIEIKFPEQYPARGNSPVFKVEENTDLTAERKEYLLSRLGDICRKYTDAGKYCLEPCLRFLLGENVNLDILDDEDEAEQLLNLDLVDANSEECSSSPSSDDKMDLPDLSGSEDEEISGFQASIADHSNEFSEAFDSTPVPKGCGAVWTATGSLLCFFMTEVDRKPPLVSTYGTRSRNSAGLKSNPPNEKVERLYDDQQFTYEKIERPKRYVETLSASSHHHSESIQTDDESDQNESDGSFADDWGDILKNDITLRTKMPIFHTNFNNPICSIRSESGRTVESKGKPKNVIVVHDFSHLIPDKIKLALEYRLMGDSPEVLARHNFAVAERHGAQEIAQCWNLLANLLIARNSDEPDNCSFDKHVMGAKWFVKEIIRYFELTKNIQMLAMIACILVDPGRRSHVPASYLPPRKHKHTLVFRGEHYKPAAVYTQMHPSNDFIGTPTTAYELSHGKSRHNHETSSLPSEEYLTTNPRHFSGMKSRSSSVFPYMDNNYSQLPDVSIEILDDEILDLPGGKLPPLLDPAEEPKFRSYRRQYAELVYYWGLPLHRVKVLKFNVNENTEPEILRALDQGISGQDDFYKGIHYKWMKPCSATSHSCAYCGLQAKKRIFLCGNCQHVLHASCAAEWWENDDECPSGCGCNCPYMFSHTP